MRRRIFCAFVILAGGVLGCGVSKDIYQSELARSQELEAHGVDLDARLKVEAAKRNEAEDALASCREQAATVSENLARTKAQGADLDSQLGLCLEREAQVRANLDLAGKTRSAAEADRDACAEERQRLEGEVGALNAEKKRLEREKREKLDEISTTYEGLLEGMKEEIKEGRVTISQLQGKLSVNVLDEILFDSGSAAVKPAGRKVLDRIGEVLKGLEDKAIVIEGHTDAMPISGELAKRFPTNWELSTARATSVVRYLQEKAGIPPERLSAVGFGPYRPVASNDTPEGRARNRRIEIKLVPLESPLVAQDTDASQTSPPTPSSPDAGAQPGSDSGQR